MIDTLGRLLTKNYIANPILIAGAGRSGTSILLQALGEHSQILSADRESPFLPYLGFLPHPFEFRENKEYHLDSLNLPLPYLYNRIRQLGLECVMGKHYGISQLRRIPKKSINKVRHWCAKTYPNYQETQGLIKLFPNVKFIYIFRNGINVVNSRSRFPTMRQSDFSEHCEVWARHVEKYNHFFDLPEAFPLRQEDVVNNPDDVFRNVLTFIGLPYEEGPANFAKTTLIHSLDNKEAKTDVDVQKIFKERMEIHQNWTDEQKTVFKKICGVGMKKLGYEIPF